MISFIKGRKALKLLVAPLAARTAIKGLTVSLGVEEFWLFFLQNCFKSATVEGV